MNSMVIIAGLILLLIITGAAEYAVHLRNLKKIPVRIHVNGTRGKSSVTRLIAAGLNEGGMRTLAKTTGTLPRIILPDGSEFPVFRPTRPNIIEQLRIIAFAARNKAQALIIECMALQPYLQNLCEKKLVQSTHGVITNVREDHLDVMGPTEKDVALAILGTTPLNATLYTCEKDYPEEFVSACAQQKATMIQISENEISGISDTESEKFSYFEHKENIALALRVCLDLGVPRDKAIRGMQNVRPDPGAMRDLKIKFFGKTVYFINGFAANDPESTGQIWQIALNSHPDIHNTIMVINCRLDRPDRSRQIGLALHDWPRPDKYILIGSGSYFLVKYAIKNGINPGLITNAEGLPTESIFEEIMNHCGERSVVMGIGNTAGPGLELIKYFMNRSMLRDNEVL
ncbi:MAG TPA: poly-gamma-glutamate synthase PgsB [Spirochaetota bacterium]|nr:poly-gamma-glutamate synthase PgsB [Spirochaetota bacterium]HPI90031.1 poly-gamma-glutamate synthase PgsB [Spirochaetota bacterium]HPR48087.1 poly-gamma-glutamate synthase PgsB [Spirochaetota bacterium]